MAAGIQIGSTFAGYSIEGVLGRGGMGVVYLAEQPELGRKVAIKVIAPALASDPDYLRRFKHESRLAAAIEHPNAIPIYEAGVAGEEIPYLVMRYVDGVDLATLIRREGKLDGARAARIVEQVSGALDEAHARGLVHRDVKPGNVIVEKRRGSEQAYLTDFGLTKQMDATSGVTATGRWVGTIDYASPEQIRGEHVDARSDVYALGCVLFVALTGQLPFEREADVAKLYAHINDPAPAPSSVAQGVPPQLDAVVGRALEKKPDRRYPSAGDLGRAALASLTGSAIGEPERTVATGEAAPVPAVLADTPTVPSERPPEAATAAPPTDAPSPASTGATAETLPPAEAPAPGPTEPTPPPAPPRRGAAGRGGRGRWVAGTAGVVAVAGLVTLGVTLFGGGDGNGGNASTGGGGNGGGGSNAGGVKFRPFEGSDLFTIEQPVGWTASYTDAALPGEGRQQVRTQLASPNHKMSLQVLREPNTSAESRAKQAQNARSSETLYKPIEAPTAVNVGRREAWLYAYVHDEPGGIGEATVYNYMFNDGGFGWRTRVAAATGGSRQAKAEQIANEAAKTLEVKPPP
jgi:predicted Ser/Thr protein kinase